MAQTRYRPNTTTNSAPKQWHQQKRWIIGSLGLLPPIGIALVLMAIANPAPAPENLSVAEQPVAVAIKEAPAVSEPIAKQPVEPKIVKAPVAPPAPQPKPAPVVPPAAYKQAIALATTATQSKATATTSADWAKIADTWQSSMSALNEVADRGSFATHARSKQKEYQVNYDYAIVQMNTAQVAEAKAIAEQQRREQEDRLAQMQRDIEQRKRQAQEQMQREAAAQVAPPSAESEGYVSGTCASLRAMGVGSDFTPGDPNYTSKRDRDGDGVACES